MLNLAAAPLQINCSPCRNKVSHISLTLPTRDLRQATGIFFLQHADLSDRADQILCCIQTPSKAFNDICSYQPFKTIFHPQVYLQSQLLDVSEQLDIFFRQVLVTRQFLVFITPIAAFLIVWGLKKKEGKNGILYKDEIFYNQA